MLRVVSPPYPLVNPDDIPGSHEANDAVVAALIEAATMAIDGPTGWVGRCFGDQVLELTGAGFDDLAKPGEYIRLPCPPIIEIESIHYRGDDDAEVEWASSGNWRLSATGSIGRVSSGSWPTTGQFEDAVRIVYRAGYDGIVTGEVPMLAKQAIILSVQHLINMGSSNALVESETVEGIGQRRYSVTPEAGALIRNATDALLRGLWIPVA